MQGPDTEARADGMTVMELITVASGHLAEKGFDNARLEVELMLGMVLERTRIQLYMEHDRPLKEEEVEQFRALYRRRLAREPLQYIIGSTGFRELEIKTDSRVFIPRPETEILVQEAYEFLRGRENPVVIDLGTGSGAIAVSIAYEIPGSRVTAVDINENALMLTEKNAREAGVIDAISLVNGDMIVALESRGTFDAILSNPPYIPTGDIDGLDDEVRDYEPVAALDGGLDGLDLLYRLAEIAPSHLNPGGMLLMECEGEQTTAVSEKIISLGRMKNVETVCDLAGKKRLVKAFAG